FGATETGTSAELRFANGDAQLAAKKAVQLALGEGYVVALNQAPTTPEWLSSLGGTPMRLGLDLRGGVHFLLEVDIDSAIAKRQETSAEEMKASLREERLRYTTVELDGLNIRARFRDAEQRDQAIS